MNEFSHNARFALIIASAPIRQHGEPDVRQWQSFQATIQKQLQPSETIQRFHDNVWLIPLDTDMRFLSKLFEWATDMSIPLRILFLDEVPDWHKYPPDPKPKPEV